MIVFYRHEQNALNHSFSPSADKPRQVVADWLQQGFDIEVHPFEPVTRHDFYLAHDPYFVDGVMNLDIANGFDNHSAEVAAALPYTTGSMLAAAEHAILHRTVACSPTSGFHHAGYDFAMGYCTFNGLMVTALKLHKDGLAKRIGILDCDAHYGNGTDHIIQRLEIDWIVHRTAGEHFKNRDDVGESAKLYLDWVGLSLNDMKDCSVILYQAGADPHIQDPLGGILSTKAMFHRDRLVYEFCESNSLPIAWNLAGGYQRDAKGTIEPVLKLHRTTCQVFTGRY
jgi:acetoin utilization deacetylase AcuC-like enzyme